MGIPLELALENLMKKELELAASRKREERYRKSLQMIESDYATGILAHEVYKIHSSIAKQALEEESVCEHGINLEFHKCDKCTVKTQAANIEELETKLNETISQLFDERAKLEKAREVIRTYGKHSRHCRGGTTKIGCNCGLDQALREIRGEKP